MHEAAIVGRIGRFLQRGQWPEAQHVFGVDGVGIAQPGLDLGDRKPARAQRDRRARARRPDRAWSLGRLIQVADPVRGGMQWQSRVLAGEQGFQAGQPTGRHHRGTVAAAGAGQHHSRRGAGGSDEVVGGLADDLFGGWQADGGAHGSGQPGTGVSGRRPDTLGEATEHHDIGGLKPRFEQPPDEDTRVFCAVSPAQRTAAAHGGTLEHRVQQARHHVEPLVRQQWHRCLHRGQMDGQCLAFFAGPQAGGTGKLVGGGETLG